MSILSDTLSRKITVLTKEQLQGASKIANYTFEGCNLLTSVDMPDSIESIGSSVFRDCTSLSEIKIGKNVKKIGDWAFAGCPKLTKIIFTSQLQSIESALFYQSYNLVDVVTENLSPYCEFTGSNIFNDTLWYKNMPEDSMILIANEKILINNKITKPGSGFVIPDTVINLASYSCASYRGGDSTFTSVVIPDTVEIVLNNVFSSQNSLKQITVGSSVRKIGYKLCPGSNITTLIFRQPKDMYIKLPKAGEDTGIYGGKNSASIDIYTDNEMLKAYDWAKDNVTATIHPLSEAPA